MATVKTFAVVSTAAETVRALSRWRVLAAGVRLLTFDRLLPYIDVHEES